MNDRANVNHLVDELEWDGALRTGAARAREVAFDADEAAHLSGAARSRERLLEGLRRDMGPFCLGALKDNDVKEILLNSDGRVWVDTYSDGWVHSGETMSVSQSTKLMMTVASLLNTVVTVQRPILQGEFPLDESRFQGNMPPIVTAPSFNIRKKPLRVYTLQEYVDSGILSPSHAAMIRASIRMKKNILVVGGTASGKTTFLNACIAEMVALCPKDRIICAEDTREVICTAANKEMLRSTLDISMNDLLKSALRMTPDRILCGEVRDKEAYALLEMWNTGHDGGLATVHGTTAARGLGRIQRLAYGGLQHGAGGEFIPQVVAEAIHVVVFIKKVDESICPAKRRVTEVLRIDGFDPQTQQYLTSPVKG